MTFSFFQHWHIDTVPILDNKQESQSQGHHELTIYTSIYSTS